MERPIAGGGIPVVCAHGSCSGSLAAGEVALVGSRMVGPDVAVQDAGLPCVDERFVEAEEDPFSTVLRRGHPLRLARERDRRDTGRVITDTVECIDPREADERVRLPNASTATTLLIVESSVAATGDGCTLNPLRGSSARNSVGCVRVSTRREQEIGVVSGRTGRSRGERRQDSFCIWMAVQRSSSRSREAFGDVIGCVHAPSLHGGE